MRLPKKQIREMLMFLAEEEQPYSDEGKFYKQEIDKVKKLVWEDDDIEVRIKEDIESISLRVMYFLVGEVEVKFKTLHDDYALDYCHLEIKNPNVDLEVWRTFWFIVNTLHDEFGMRESDCDE